MTFESRLLFLGLLLAAFIYAAQPAAAADVLGTPVSGVISSDTTWTKAGSPYQASGNVGIASGATLTIEHGVQVRFSAGQLQVGGTLLAQGTSSDPVVFTCSSAPTRCWGGIDFTSTQNGSSLTYTDISYTYDTGLKATNGNWTISRSRIHHNSYWGARLSGTCCGPPIGIFSGNVVDHNGLEGVSIFYRVAQFDFNTIRDNPTGVKLLGNGDVLENNNLLDNSTYNASTCFYSSAASVTAENNWWGTTDTTAISQKVCDYNDDISRAAIDFTPYASASILEAGAVADLGVQITDSPDPVGVGEQVTYSVSTHNYGFMSAAHAELSIQLPAGFSISSITPSAGTCSEDSGAVGCDLGTLPSDGNVTVAVVGTPAAAGQTVVTVAASSLAIDTNSTNSSAVTSTSVEQRLSVSKTGTGSGTIVSSPAGISCGATCTTLYPDGALITLDAGPATSSDFEGWSGACTGTGPCEVTMDAVKNVTAAFTLKTFSLDLSTSGNGSGTVSSTPAGIDCGGDCSEIYGYGTSVTLSAAPEADSVFAGWSGACSGQGSCTVTMTGTRSVGATFLVARDLALTVEGTGLGLITSAPAGIECGSDCSETFGDGTVVTLTAAPATSSNFIGWSGACTGSGTCEITMNAAESVTASFALKTYALTMSKNGNGSGSVSSSPVGINCGVDCTETYDHGTLVTLTATLDPGSVFTGWSGACSGTANCSVSMTQARSVGATFVIPRYQPDGALKLTSMSRFVGGNIYNTTARRQTVATKARRGSRKSFIIAVQNDGNLNDSITVKAAQAPTGVSYKFLRGTTDVTRAIKGGTFRFSNLIPGASRQLKLVITIKSGAAVGTTKRVLVTLASATSPTKKDAVRAVVNVT